MIHRRCFSMIIVHAKSYSVPVKHGLYKGEMNVLQNQMAGNVKKRT